MIVVLDASAAISVTLKREGHESIGNAINQFDRILAPEIFRSETANALWKEVTFRGFDSALASSSLEIVHGMIDDYIPASENISEAFFEAIHHNHNVYDMLYLTLARRNNAALITLDKKLSSLAANQGIAIYLDMQ